MKPSWLALVVSVLCAVGITAWTLAPYGGHPSALFHYGTDQSVDDLPSGFVVLDVPSYDGALYYRIARQMPLIFSAGGREELATTEPKSYAYQRVLLPALAAIVSFGNDVALPWAFLAINLLAIAGTGYVLLRGTGNALAILALTLSPAAMLGLHFSLAEPVTILLLTMFLIRAQERAPDRAQEWARWGFVNAILLSLAVLAREVNFLFAFGALAWFVLHRRWRDAAWMLVPIAVFALWHSIIFSIFGEWPFFLSADKRDLPLVAIREIISGTKGYNAYTLSSIALLLLFVLPVLGWTLTQVIRRKDFSLPTLGALAFALLMLTMADHIWGSITSIGRVITPVYPCAVVALAMRDTWPARAILSATMLLGLTVGISLALNVHPFHLA